MATLYDPKVEKIERLAFFGTPDFALPTLQALVAAGRVPVVVVTQPDRPAGRGQRVQAPVVARWAREQGLEVWQPARVREAEVVERVRALGSTSQWWRLLGRSFRGRCSTRRGLGA